MESQIIQFLTYCSADINSFSLDKYSSMINLIYIPIYNYILSLMLKPHFQRRAIIYNNWDID